MWDKTVIDTNIIKGGKTNKLLPGVLAGKYNQIKGNLIQPSASLNIINNQVAWHSVNPACNDIALPRFPFKYFRKV